MWGKQTKRYAKVSGTDGGDSAWDAAAPEGEQPAASSIPTRRVVSFQGDDDDRAGLLGHEAGAGGEGGPGPTWGRATTVQTYVTFFKVFFGIGVLAMPRCFVYAGYVGGSLGTVCIAWLSVYCIELLMASRDRIVENERVAAVPPRRVNTSGGAVLFVDVVAAAFGARGRAVAEFCVLSSQLGFAISYLIFIGANEGPVAALLGFGEEATAAVELWSSAGCVAVAALLLLPLVWLRDLRRLACGALVADVSIIFGLGTVTYYAVRTLLLGADEDDPYVPLPSNSSGEGESGGSTVATVGDGLPEGEEELVLRPISILPVALLWVGDLCLRRDRTDPSNSGRDGTP
jgi:uncharacterized membrane protein